MLQKILLLSLFMLLAVSVLSFAQTLDGSSYTPGKDANIDLFISSWQDSEARNTHGSLVERNILFKGDPENPPAKGAVLIYINRFTYATLEAHNATQPTTLKGEQEILYILSGKGVIEAGGEKADLYRGICILMPAGLEFTMINTGDKPLTLYLVNEPVPLGFRPNRNMLVRDENTIPVISTKGHWCHITKTLFETADGLGTLEYITTCSFDPMTIGHPHSHDKGTEEVWTGLSGTSIAFIGKQIRVQPPGTAYMIPPNGNTPHSNINTSNERIKIFYFARYRDHEVRK
ncbi:cupin domain-containing protein [Candidatus Latescibacterota bacterium]